MINVHAAGKEPYVAAPAPPTLSIKDIFLLLSMILVDSLTVLVLSVPVILKGLAKFVIPPGKKEISGWTALVTGAGHGIGKAIAVELAKEGCNLAIVDIDGEAAIEVANSLAEYNVQAVAYKIDVADRKSLRKLKENIEKDIGPVDILVNNAGLMPLLSLREGCDEDVDRIIAVNINSHLFLVRTFIDGMIKRKRGHIVTLSSMGAIHPFAGGIIYCATKYAVTGFSRALEEELRQEGHGDYIQILSVHPYFVATRKDVMESVDLRFPAVTAESTGKAIVDAILRNARIVVIPWILNPFLRLVSILPYRIHTMCRDYVLREQESRRIKDPQNYVIPKGGASS